MIRKLKKSWTVWLNALSIMLVGVEAQLGYLREAMSPEHFKIMLVVYAALNILLRLKTEAQK